MDRGNEGKEIWQKVESGSDWLRVLCSSLGRAALWTSPSPVCGCESRGLPKHGLLSSVVRVTFGDTVVPST